MPAGRVLGVYKKRLAASVSSTVTTGATVVPVDSNVVDFDEEGGQFLHVATGDVYTYDSADFDLETITLAAALPGGRTLSADDALHVIAPDGRRSFDYYADIAVDDVANDVVSAAVPEELQQSIAEGAQKQGEGQLVIADAEGEEWQVQRLVGEEAPAGLVPGDIKATARAAPNPGSALVDGGWLYCNGQSISRAVYAALFNAIGTTFGAGDGSTTFQIPDLRGRAIFGASASFPLGDDEGVAEANRGPGHTHSISNSSNHNHDIEPVDLNQLAVTPGGAGVRLTNPATHDHTGRTTGTDGIHDHGGLTGGGTQTASPLGYAALTYLIKV